MGTSDRRSPPPEAPPAANALGPEPPRPSPEEVHERTFAYVWRLLGILGIRGHDEREEAAQAIYLVVFERLSTYDPRRSLEAWVGGIAWNVAAQRRARAKRLVERLAPGGDEALEAIATPTPDPERQAEVAERRRVLEKVLDAIPEERRLVLVLKEAHGLDMIDVAEALEIPVNTAWNRLRLAKEDFRRAVRRLDARERDALGVREEALSALVLADLLRSELTTPEVIDELRASVWASLARAGTRVGAGMGIGSLSARAASAGAVLVRAKLAGAGALLFLAGLGVGTRIDPSRRPAPHRDDVVTICAARDALAAAPPITPPSPPASSSTPAPAPVASTPQPRVRSSDTARSSDDGDGALLQRAGAALAGGRASEALALVDRHARAHPRSRLAQEREVIAVQALAAAGQTAAARERAGRFRRAWPDSHLRSAVDALLAPSIPK